MTHLNAEEQQDVGTVPDLAASLHLEPGEAYFVRYLQQHLPSSWQLYVQPPLNGRRPDVIVMNPRVGIMIYEVKNWNPDSYCQDSGRILLRRTARPVEVPSPVGQVQAYREQIIRFLVPNLGLAVLENRSAYACVRVGVVFPHESASRARARQLLDPLLSDNERRHVTIIGRDDLEQGAGALRHILPDAGLARSHFFTPEMAEDLKRWICEPEAEAEQREPLHLTDRQREIATTRTSTGYRRVKGGAGSGKSQALAARAGQLALDGKRVLACCFNITMTRLISWV